MRAASFKGVDEDSIPWTGHKNEKTAEEGGKGENERANRDKEASGEKQVVDPIDRLHALEDRDMNYWLSSIVPGGTPCHFIVGLIDSPWYQSRGVGSALIQHGNMIADKLNLCTLVHSSHQPYAAYEKFSFKFVRELDIDLYEYTPRGPREGEEVMGEKGSQRWGRCVIRYMNRIAMTPGYSVLG
jgi:hypothetical protein